MPRMLSDGDDLLLWVPDGGIDNVSAPTVAELTAAGVVDLTTYVAKNNFTLGATGDTSIDDPDLASSASSTVPGITNYQAGMDFFRDSVEADDKAYTTFTGKGISGFLVHRVGKKPTVPIAASDDVRVLGVITGTPQPLIPDAQGGFRKFHQDFYVQGELVDERAVVSAT